MSSCKKIMLWMGIILFFFSCGSEHSGNPEINTGDININEKEKEIKVIKIRGVVQSKEERKLVPVSGVIVKCVENISTHPKTDVDGEFVFDVSNISTEITVSLEKEGYEEYNKTLTIPGDGSTLAQIEFVLKKK